MIVAADTVGSVQKNATLANGLSANNCSERFTIATRITPRAATP